MKIKFLILALPFVLLSCINSLSKEKPVDYVNTLIGTDAHGHTYPGATSPFGMVQLSPDTKLEGWDGCSGYHYSDSVIYGFSHTHLSGTGVSDYADILLMPINGKSVFNNKEYLSAFSHQNEIAKAGYYSVLLDKYQILAELTTTNRTGMHRYTYKQKSGSKLVLDLSHRDLVLDSYLEILNDSTIQGYRVSSAWAQEQHVYFYIQFSQAFKKVEVSSEDSILSLKTIRSKNIKSVFCFDNLSDNQLIVKVGVSAVDMQGAKRNLEIENPNWNFDEVKKNNQNQWNEHLRKVTVKDEDERKKAVFYTSLYHNLIVPNTFSDVDGRYRGMDLEIHSSEKPQYTIFSLWDTYRATHPLYTILEPQKVRAFIHTFKNQYDDGGILPIWELSGNYTGCMIAYHSIPVIVDAYFKGLTDISADKLLKMMINSANQDKLGLKAVKAKGYISIEDDAESVSKTLEYAYDDWCIAQFAKAMGKDSVYRVFLERAQGYKNLFDTETGCMRPKLNETWKTPFNPSEVDFNYTEANSWQYSFYVPQDVFTLIDMMGGKDNFENQLDHLFNAPSKTTGRHQSDITGLVGQYAHGNEPSHHMAYLYNYVNKPEKTGKYVSKIINELYTDQPDGLCGNEDCGQMSAWYVFSAMGFYPVNPANGEYVFGKPFFDEITIHLDNGKDFVIRTKGNKDANVKSIRLNGKDYDKSYISHKDILKGGELMFEFSDHQSIRFKQTDLPTSLISEHLILPTVSIRKGDRVFRDSTSIELESVKGAKIYYSIGGNKLRIYESPITIKETTSIYMYAEKESLRSREVKATFYKIPKGRTIDLQTNWHPQYPAGGKEALIDGLTGVKNFRSGTWQGFYFDDVKAVVDLGKATKIKKVSINFIQDTRSWIWMPPYVEFWGSEDGINFESLGKVENDVPTEDFHNVYIKNFAVKFSKRPLKYVKVFAKNELYCPGWHLGAGGKAFVFADEIMFE